MKDGLVAHRPWLRFYLAGLVVSALLSMAGVWLMFFFLRNFELTFSYPWLGIVAGALASSIFIYFISLLFHPIRRIVWGADFSLIRITLVYFLIPAIWALLSYLTLDPSEATMMDKLLPAHLMMVFTILPSLPQGFLIWLAFRLTYRLRPVRTVDTVFT